MSRAFGTVVWFLLVSACFALAKPSDLVTPVEYDIDVPASLQEYLESSQVVRHRFVTVDIEYLWNLFESVRDLDSFDHVERIELKLFEDFSVEMRLVKVIHNYWRSHATLVTTMPGFSTDADANIFADVTLKRDESISARIYAAGDIYHISPVEGGPVHVVVQADMDYLRDNSDM